MTGKIGMTDDELTAYIADRKTEIDAAMAIGRRLRVIVAAEERDAGRILAQLDALATHLRSIGRTRHADDIVGYITRLPSDGEQATTHRLWVNGVALDAVYKDGRYHVIEELIEDPFSNVITSDLTDEMVDAAAEAWWSHDITPRILPWSQLRDDMKDACRASARAGLTAVLRGDRS